MNKKELLFCKEYLKSFDEHKAAKAAGYDMGKTPLVGLRLLYKTEVVAFLKQQLEKEKQIMPSVAHLVTKKIASSDISDAIYYATNKDKLTKKEIECLNLLMIREVKVKEDSVEMKFHDRLKALEMLQKSEELSKEELGSFLSGLKTATQIALVDND